MGSYDIKALQIDLDWFKKNGIKEVTAKAYIKFLFESTPTREVEGLLKEE